MTTAVYYFVCNVLSKNTLVSFHLSPMLFPCCMLNSSTLRIFHVEYYIYNQGALASFYDSFISPDTLCNF